MAKLIFKKEGLKKEAHKQINRKRLLFKASLALNVILSIALALCAGSLLWPM